MEKITVDIPLIKSLVSLASIIEARDSYTGGHIWRVSQYARMLAETLNIQSDMLFFIELGGLIHDLGKIGIADNILNKKETLTPDEYTVMKKHPAIGNELISLHPLYPISVSAIAEHHEWINGRGYPNGLDGDAISPVARIITIADAFDAMTSFRPYRSAMKKEAAVEIIQKAAGEQFDDEYAKVFISLVQSGRLDHIIGYSNAKQHMLSCNVCGPIIAPSLNLKNGDTVICPACRGIYHTHSKGDTFETEWNGKINPEYVPSIDNDTINYYVSHAPANREIVINQKL